MNPVRLRRACLLALPLAVASACSLQPEFVKPDPAVATAYPNGAAYDITASASAAQMAASDLGWRDFFGDPQLQQFVTMALQTNRDLQVAALTALELKSQWRIESAGLLPQVTMFADRSRSRTPADLSKSGSAETAGSYSVGASLGWEIDLFGKLRSLRESALQEYLASVQGRNAVQMSLIAQVGAAYLVVLACDEMLEVTDRTLESARASYDLTKLQFDIGSGSELDLRQAETLVEQALANRAAQVRARAQAQNALTLLVGQPNLPEPRDSGQLSNPNLLADVPAGLPSHLLTRRPDVLQAEALLRSANADIGAARAAFFPSIDLTGTAGSASAHLDGLVKAGSAAWTVAPVANLPLFVGGANRANLKAAEVREQIAVAQYQRTVQGAFREVADGLAARVTFKQQIASLERYVEAQRRRLELAQVLYRNGESSYLDVLTAQDDLYDSQLVLVSTRLQRLTNLIDLYRALGGGWVERTGDEPPRSEDVR